MQTVIHKIVKNQQKLGKPLPASQDDLEIMMKDVPPEQKKEKTEEEKKKMYNEIKKKLGYTNKYIAKKNSELHEKNYLKRKPVHTF
jgi:hypothetical protein